MIRCLAIDDEMLALDLLEDNIKKVPFLELVQTCRSAMEAMEVLRSQPVDLLFLDIQMPDISGIQLLRSLHHKPLVIFTTAFSKYATDGFDLDVIDYLLKPYAFERFLKAVNKVREYIDLRDRASVHPSAKEIVASPNYLFVKADYKLYKINLKDILYVEGLKDYVKIYAGEKPVVTQISMKALEEKLPAHDFIRVHRSFIVAFNKIDFIQKHMLTIGKKEIPISEHYRDQLYKIINYEKPLD
ncbi:MAG: LytTR family DNA-binding domain-containing protein [Bacteroidetes bacterium]|nr:LytTR family DNA-binding domain-containing protein [Bacteroidota bacterium]